MKFLFFILGVVAFALSAIAQISSVTRPTMQGTGFDRTFFFPSNSTGVAPASPRFVMTPIPLDAGKDRIRKDELQRRTIAFQEKQASEGAPTAQYDLGMRYLRGDGVPQNAALALKWLKLSAAQTNSLAIKRLKEMNAP